MQRMRGIDWGVRIPVGGRHVVTDAEANANAAAIATGVADATVFFVQVFRAGADVTVDAVVTLASGVLTVADGGETYIMTADDVINWMVL